MPMILIKAIAPTILLLSIFVPFFLANRGRRLAWSLFSGWFLFVLSFLFNDIFSLLLASHFHGREAANAIAVDQPGTVGAVVGGWVLPLISHAIGRGVKALVGRFSKEAH